MKSLYARDITKAVFMDTAYGGDISKEQEPVFSYMGLGVEGNEPGDAYPYFSQYLISHAVALNQLHGMAPNDAVAFAHHCIETQELLPHVVRALLKMVQKFRGEEPTDETEGDVIVAVIGRNTRELLFYHFFIEGDGYELVFTLD